MDERGSKRINLLSWHDVKWQAMRERDRANDKRTSLWAFAWVVSLAVARLPVVFTHVPQWLGWILAAVSLGVGVQFVGAYLQMVRKADELFRQVQLEGLAVGFAAGLICGFSEMLFGTPKIWWSLSILVAMSLGYLASVMWAARGAARDSQ